MNCNEAHVMRWVPTWVKRTPYKSNDDKPMVLHERRIMGPRQGRYTYATREECQAHLDAILENGSWKSAGIFGANPEFETREVQCWPKHFDPKEYILDLESVPA